jgi:hypothetical protein
MRVIQLTAFIPIIFTASTHAGYNCKCQDARGQYNDLTKACCLEQFNANDRNELHGPGPNSQCVSDFNGIDNGEFVRCCIRKGVGGAFCWGN